MASRAGRIVRKTLRWSLRIGLVLILTVLATGVLLLYSPGFLHVVINLGLGFYNDRIPGEIRIGRVEGRLADHLVLGDIYLEDGDGRALVVARELTLDWSPWDLLDGKLTASSLTLHDAQVHLVAGGGFGDLATPGPAKPPRETIAPALPLDLNVASVEIGGVDLMADDGHTIVGGARLSARDLHWFGLVAHLELTDGAGQVPGVVIEALALTADFGEPNLQLHGSVTTELGVVTIDRLDLDAARLDGEATIAVDGRREALMAKLPPAVAAKLTASDDPIVRVHARGTKGRLALGVHAQLPGLATLDVAVAGSPFGAPHLTLRGRAEADLEPLVPAPFGARLGVVQPSFDVALSGADWSQLAAELRLHCGACGAASGLELHALATRDSVLSDLGAYVRLTGIGVDLGAELRAGPLGPEAGRWDLNVPDVAEPLGVARLFVDLPPLAAGLRSHGSCTGAPLRCEGALVVDKFAGFKVGVDSLQVAIHGEPLAPVPALQATLSARGVHVPGQRFAGVEVSARVGKSELAPVDVQHPNGVMEIGAELELWVKQRGRGDRGKLAARVLLADPLVILLDALELQLRGLQARLPRPARIELAGRRVDIRGLGLRAASGEIGVDGRLDLDGRSDLKAHLDHVRLAPLVAMVPALRGQIGGSVTARASLVGPASAPELSLVLGGQKLRFRDGILGDLDLVAGLARGRAHASLGVVGSMAEQLTASAELPVALDLSRGTFAVRSGGLKVALDVEDFRLASLGPWVKTPRKLRGLIDAQVTVDGPTAHPVIDAHVAGSGLIYGEDVPATLDLIVKQPAGGDLSGRLDVERLGGRVRVNVARLPARFDLVHGPLHWRPEGQHDVTVVARDIQIWRQLNAIQPGHVYAGALDLQASLKGSMVDPDIELAVKGAGLRVRDGLIGNLSLVARMHAQRLTADLDLRGSVVRLVTVHAEAPLHVALHRGEFTWLKDQAHVLDAKVGGFNLATLKGLGLSAAFAGFVDAEAHLRGTARAPELKLHTDLYELVWKDRRVGTAHVDVDYAKRRINAKLDGQLGHGTVKLRGSAPLVADLGAMKFTWDENGQHDVELRVDDLDRTMLAPLGRVPEEALIELSLIARAKGNLAAFHADLQAHGQMGHKLIGGAPLHITASVDPKRQSLTYSLGPHKWAGEMSLRADSTADILALARGTAKAKDIAFTASFRAPKFDTRFAQAFVPKNLYDLNGELAASIDAHGTLGAPDVKGELHLRRGSITVLELQQRIRKIELDLKADGRTIVLESLTAESGKGGLKGSGRLELPRAGGMKLSSTVELRRFPLVRPGLPQMQIDTKLRASMVATPDETDISLNLKGTKVSVTGYNIDPPKQIPVNPSVTYKDNKERVGVAVDAGPQGEVTAENAVETPKPEAPAPARKFAMRVKLEDPVEIRGPATDMVWQGAVAATRDGEAREVTGRLTAKEGRLDLLGNRFKIESGEVTLPEDEDTVDPFIRVVARTSTPVAEVTATFSGRLSRPKLDFRSEPSMTQSQILTLLLTGSPDASEADESRVLAQAAALLATFENPQLSAFLSSRLGIDHVGLSFGDDVNQPILSVGKRLTRKIYVETAYKVNAPRRQNRVEARVEYQFAPRWTIETFFGDAAVGGLDVFWRKVFGAPKQAVENAGKPVPKPPGEARPPGNR